MVVITSSVLAVAPAALGVLKVLGVGRPKAADGKSSGPSAAGGMSRLGGLSLASRFLPSALDSLPDALGGALGS